MSCWDVWVWCSVDTGHTMIYCHKHFELHQHEMHKYLHPHEYILHPLCTSFIYEDMWGPLWTLETMSHGHYKHWRCQHNSYLPWGDLTGDKSDNLLILSSQESSGSVQGSLSVDISQEYRQAYRVSLWWRVKICDTGWQQQCDPLYGVPGHTQGSL